MSEYQHIPVMLNEVLEYLQLQDGDIVVDGTLGLAGHSKAILQKIGSGGKLVGIDRDGEALLLAQKNLNQYHEQCSFAQDNFHNIDKVLDGLGIQHVDRILLDLGVSSFQLDDPQRGFSLRSDGPLDMRMDQGEQTAAVDLINLLSEKELATILKEYGQERWHNRIARALVTQRETRRIQTTSELSQVILRAIPSRRKWTKIHPATRTFQALRIAVNKELESIESALDKCIDRLNSKGRIAVIAFHSLEDRIVKCKFRDFAKSGYLNLITKKPLKPTEQESIQNPRARSACLRAAERI